MGRYLGSSCKYCRREGMKLMLKGIRCETAKCPIEKKQRNLVRRNVAPREKIEELKDDYIDYAHYQQICRDNRLPDEDSQLDLLKIVPADLRHEFPCAWFTRSGK